MGCVDRGRLVALRRSSRVATLPLCDFAAHTDPSPSQPTDCAKIRVWDIWMIETCFQESHGVVFPAQFQWQSLEGELQTEKEDHVLNTPPSETHRPSLRVTFHFST